MSERRKSYKRGLWAERLAAAYLMLKGYRIIKLRYKTPVGEIDILAKKKDCLVAVEVKARKSLDAALEAVLPRSRKRIEKTMLHFVAFHEEYSACAIRFDVIAMCLAVPFSFKHLDNAWQARS